MSFVDWNHQSSTCRILLAGLDPNGYAQCQRNVVSMQYNESITSYFIRQKFPFVKTVYIILSDDADFDEIVAPGAKLVLRVLFLEIYVDTVFREPESR